MIKFYKFFYKRRALELEHGPSKQIMKEAANFVACQQKRELAGIQDELNIPRDPRERTVDWYIALLNKACEDFFMYADDDNLLEILQDAKKNEVDIKEYKSIPVKRFDTFNVSIRKATLFWNSKGANVVLYIGFARVLISAKKFKGKIEFSQNLKKIIKTIQETLAKIDKLL